MKKPLLTGLCCLLFSGILQARHEQDSVIVQLGEVTIQENRLEIPYNKSSRNVSVITRKAIETTPARSLQEVLSFTPGVDVRQRGVSGVQANIGIRGGSFEQTLMLLNGIKLTDPQTGHHMMNIPVPLMAIQQVDVLKGPGSSIYGQNAFAGAVNIITRLPEEKSIQAQLFGGDFGMRGANAVLSLPVGKYKQTISFSHDASNGHWHNSDFVVNNLFYEGGITTGGKHKWRTMLGYTERDFGANGFYTDAFPDQWEAVSTYLASLSHTYRDGGLYLQTRAYWRRNDDEFRLRREEPEFFTNFHVSDVYALEVNGRYTSSLGSTGFGVEGRSEQLNSTNLGERERYFLGVFGEHRVEFLDCWDARAGVYANFYDEFGWRAFPGAEIGFQASERGRFYSSYGVSFRIPSFTELYYVDPSNSSNPDLLPEEAYNFEVGYKYVGERLRAEAVYFFRDTRNLIDYTRAPVAPGQAPQPWRPDNVSEVRFNGIELGLAYGIREAIGNFRIDEISFSYNYIDADLNQRPELESRNTLTSLRHQVIGGVQTSYKNFVELNVKARYIERFALDPYFLLDARMDIGRLRKWGGFAEISNITNTDYIEAGFVQMPGRWFRMGLTLNLFDL